MSNSFACSSTYLKGSSGHLWGTVVGDKAQLLVSTGILSYQNIPILIPDLTFNGR